MYKNHKYEFQEWLYSKYCEQYSKDIYNTLDKVFNNSKSTFEEVKYYIKTNNDIALRSSTLSIRVFFNYCENREIISREILQFMKNSIKLHSNKRFDTKTTNTDEVLKLLNNIKSNNPKYEFYIRFLIESGARITELIYFLKHYKGKNVEEWEDEIILYNNFYIRGQKSSFYLFITKSTFNLYDPNLHKPKDIEHLKNIIDYRELLNLKYLRKYNFTLMIENNVSLEIANFIQGRISNNVGFNHYLHKKVIAIREYKKILPHLKF